MERAVALLGFVKRNGSRQKLPVGTEQPNIVHAITRRANDNEQVRAYELLLCCCRRRRRRRSFTIQ